MSKRGIVFNPEFSLPLDAPARPQHADHLCEAPGCSRFASFGVRRAGWARIHAPCRWFCGVHVPREVC
jgi:hypothetical protein